MKKLIILIIYLNVIPFITNAQYFNKLFTIPYPYYGAVAGAVTAEDGGFTFACAYYNTKIDTNFIHIIKVDSKGDTIWTKKYRPNTKKQIYEVNNMTEVENGNLLIIGDALNKDSTAYTGHFFLLKVDKNGNLIWSKQYTNGTRDCSGSSIINTNSGYIYSGYGQTYNEQTKQFGDSNAFILKIDTSGKEIWQKTIGVSTHHEILTGIVETSDSNLLFVGRKYNGNGFDNIVVKLNKNGQLIWNKNFGVAQYDEAFSTIIRSKDNNFIICGGAAIQSVGSIPEDWSILTKIDKDGNKIWDKKYTSGTSDMTFEHISELEDGSIITAGQQDSYPYKAGITKLDKNGTVLWHRIIEYNKADKAAERVNAFSCTKDNGFLLAGSALPINISPTNYQAWIVKLDSLGCDYAGCAKSTSTAEVENGRDSFTIVPNPAQSEITIALQNDDESIMSIYSLSGAIVKQEVCTNKISTINISTIENGMYLVVIQNKQGISTQKLIINR